jgi:hypothetical protein
MIRQAEPNVLKELGLSAVAELVPWMALVCGATEMPILLAGIAIVGGAVTILLAWSSLGVASLLLAPVVGSVLAAGTAIALAFAPRDRSLARTETRLRNSQS